MKAFVFLAEGFEEIEALASIDILRRGAVEVQTVSITNQKTVVGAHQVPVVADVVFSQLETSDAQLLVLPGGLPGSTNLQAHEGLSQLIKQFHQEGKYLAAICAAPLVFGGLGLLQGKKATCYPGVEPHLLGAQIVNQAVVQDGNIITGKGPGLAFDFALHLVGVLQGSEKAREVATGMLL